MWKDIPGWEDRYQASTEGNIRSKDMTVGAINGFTAVRKGRELVLITKTNHYLCVTLAKGTVRKQYCVHDLVMLTFKGPKPAGMQTAHNDGDRKNNRFSNLRYDTPEGNNLDKFSHGTVCKGESHGMSKLSQKDVDYIRRSNLDREALAKKFGVRPSTIWSVRTFRSWKD